MKNTISVLWAISIAAILFLVTGCENEKTSPEPVINVDQVAPVVSVEGGIFTVPYELTNPIQGAELTAVLSQECDWVKNLRVSDKEVIADIDPNPELENRTVDVNLEYDKAKPVKVSIVQQGHGVPFVLKEGDITPSEVKVAVTPYRDDIVYYSTIVPASAGYEDSKVIEDNSIALINAAAQAGVALQEILKKVTYKGSNTVGFWHLMPETEYIVYTYGMDEGANAVTMPVKMNVKTAKVQHGEPSGATITVEVQKLRDISAEIKFTPSDNTMPYYISVLDQAGYDQASLNWESYVYTYFSDKVTDNLKLTDIINTFSQIGTISLPARGFTPETKYYAVAVGIDSQARFVTELFVVPFVTLPEIKIDYGFDIAVTQITSRGATVNVKPRDASANYYWNVMKESDYQAFGSDKKKMAEWFLNKMKADRIAAWGDYADMFGNVAEYIYMQCTHDGQEDNYTYTTLDASTEYRVYAFWVDAATGDIISTPFWSEKFVTKKKVISNVTMEVVPLVTTGDNWAKIGPNQRYEYLAGKAVLGAGITPGEGVVEWRSEIYPADQMTYTDDELLKSVMLKGKKNQTAYYNVNKGVEWGGEYVILSVAIDADGNNGKLIKTPFTVDKANVTTLTELPKGY